jgi:tetratricopeptide (TPR) repeat protein
MQLLDEALQAARRGGDSWEIAMKLWRLGDATAWQNADRAEALYAESLSRLRHLGDRGLMGWVLISMGDLARRRGNYDEAATLLEEALAHTTAGGHSMGIAEALHGLGSMALDSGDYGRAAALLDEGLVRSREAGHRPNFAKELCMRGQVALAQDDVAHATALAEEGLDLARSIDDKPGMGLALHLLGRIAQRHGDLARASRLLAESLLARHDAASYDVPETLEGLASLATARAAQEADGQRHAIRAARLWGAAAAARDALSIPMRPIDQETSSREMSTARTQLGEAAWAAAWAEGQAMSLEQAIANALQEDT